jgi:predicted N-formylglutamate amidohydrolase
MFTLVLTCEHASNTIPTRYVRYFETRAAQLALSTHAGIDLGALQLARALQRRLGVRLFSGKVSRLLIELNRSNHHPRLWSRFSQRLTEEEKAAVVSSYYDAHRSAVTRHVESIEGEMVVHIGVHSFTPSLDGELRNADIGLLYDPRRAREREFCRTWHRLIESAEPNLRVRRNYPYRGNTDGFTTTLRRRFSARRYLGIELEVNQAKLVGETSQPERLARVVTQTLRLMLDTSTRR